MTTANRRPGLSLTEVLVALFIMAIGAISILTLFPLAALNMAAALKDDRTTQSAYQADGFIRSYWRSDGPDSPSPDPFTNAFTNPGGVADISTNTTGTSYPVFVDPMGSVARGGNPPPAVAGQPHLPRRNLRLIESSPRKNEFALRTSSLVDGLTFDPAQEGAAGDGTTVEREYRYNWLWVLQLPDLSLSARNKATLTVVVFDKRSHLFVPDRAETFVTPVDDNGVPNPTVTPGQTTSLTVRAADVAGLVVQKGSWVMDATKDDALGIRHANFYRIVSATDRETPNGTVFDLGLDAPLRRADGGAGAYPLQQLVFLAGVAEVFTRKPLKP